MNLLIKGMDMPKDYKSRIAALDRQTDDGILRLFISDFDREAMKYSCRVYPIVEIPTPHGRLIDADSLIEYINKELKGDEYIQRMFRRIIKSRPTIIEAEE